MKNIRTRFAPSPTGFIHLGNIRSALYPWAFARHNKGEFILRIEDTDLERSSSEAVDVIIQGMQWLGLDIDNEQGEIFYQTKRLDIYKTAVQDMLDKGLAYYCYTSIQELDSLREQQIAQNLKPKYDGKWRPEIGKILPPIPENIKPVVRFKNPLEGLVTWNDCVKGTISIANEELDDFIIARADGMPTYNFCVVIDDLDMKITHVIRGDDHVNNTPRQINILKALNKEIPTYAHLPTVLNEQGEKMSKRNGAMHVMSYKEEGYLPQAIINYLARLGWSHGNDEIFTTQQFIQWFNLDNLGSSAAQFNSEKLNWLNAQYIKNTPDIELAKLAKPFFEQKKYSISDRYLEIINLLKSRSSTLKELANNASIFNEINRDTDEYRELEAQYITPNIIPVIQDLSKQLQLIEWNSQNISDCLKLILKKHDLKMPALAMPIRVLTVGTINTPAIDKVLDILGQNKVIQSLSGLSCY